MKVDDGPWVIDGWKDQPATTYTAGVPVTAGEHTVTVEYFENTGAAVAQVCWAVIDSEVPAAPPEPTVTSGSDAPAALTAPPEPTVTSGSDAPAALTAPSGLTVASGTDSPVVLAWTEGTSR